MVRSHTHKPPCVCFYIVKYMLGEARPEPIGMSCGAHMDTAYSLELYVMSCQTYLEYSRETEEKGRRNLCTNVATSVAYSSFKELKQMCTYICICMA